MMSIAGDLDRQLVLASHAQRVLRGVVVGSAVAGLIGIAWVMRRPAPAVPVIKPSVPGLLAATAGGPSLTVAIPEALFHATPLPSTGEVARPIAVEAATSWRVLGIDLESTQPAALMRESREGSKSVWVHVGDQLERLTIKQIQAGRVVVDGGNGEFEIRL